MRKSKSKKAGLNLSVQARDVVTSERFFTPLWLESRGEDHEITMRKVYSLFEHVRDFEDSLQVICPGAAMLDIEGDEFPHLSRIRIDYDSEECTVHILCTFSFPFPKNYEFWQRVALMNEVYDEISSQIETISTKNASSIKQDGILLSNQPKEEDEQY